MNYKIILDEPKLDDFLEFLPELQDHEVYYLCLFGRHKYDPAFPNTKDSGQLVRVVARNKPELKEKIRRMEAPLGSYTRDGVVASQEEVDLYISMNPRSLIRANKGVLMELANRFAAGDLNFNPISLVTTEIHRAVDRKFVVDFDYDNAEPSDYLPRILDILPDPSMFRVLKTRGGFHLLVILDKVRSLKTQWHPALSRLPNCDVKGSNTLTPVPGCTQGGTFPYFIS